MEIKEIKEKELEEFLSNLKEKTFLQSWKWKEFNEKMGKKTFALGIYNPSLIGTAIISKIKARRGTFLLIQHGPIIVKDREKAFSFFIEEVKKIAKREKAKFIRLNPLWKEIPQKLILSPIQENAYESTLKLNITPSEEDLLKSFRKTTRYLIKKAEKDEKITIEKTDNKEKLVDYFSLNKKVANRQGFVPFSNKYIEKEFEAFLGNALLFLGRYEGEVGAGAIVIFWGGIAFYHQAASDSKFMKHSIPYLIQWEAIKEAKKRGCFLYDFWGYVDPSLNPNHPWAGPTLFKLGYRPTPFIYEKSRDIPVSPLYYLTYLFERLRKLKRKI